MDLIKVGDLIINLGEGNLSHVDLAAVKRYAEWPDDAGRQVEWFGKCLRMVMREAGTSYDADGYAVNGGMTFEFVGEDAARVRTYLGQTATVADLTALITRPYQPYLDLYAKPPMPTDYPRLVQQDGDSDIIPF